MAPANPDKALRYERVCVSWLVESNVLVSIDIYRCKTNRAFVVQKSGQLLRRVARELEVRKTYRIDDYLIGADVGGCLKTLCAGICDVVVLIDAIAAHSESAYENSVLV